MNHQQLMLQLKHVYICNVLFSLFAFSCNFNCILVIYNYRLPNDEVWGPHCGYLIVISLIAQPDDLSFSFLDLCVDHLVGG